MGSRLGIMGGTFDPIHIGHLVAAEEALSQYGLDEVVFIPAGSPWMKDHAVAAPSEDRYMMTFAAIASNPDFSVSRMEIEREGATHTIDTLRRLHEERGEDTELFFITGADAVLELPEWKEPEEVLRLARVIAATRPGYDLSALEEGGSAHHLNVSVMLVPALAISSTDIRARAKEGKPIRYLVTDPVVDYIAKAGLYR